MALTILGTGVAAVLGLLATGASITGRAADRVLSMELAEQRLEDLLLLPAERVPEMDGAEGVLPAPNEEFRWRTRVIDGPATGTLLLEVAVLGRGDSAGVSTLRRR